MFCVPVCISDLELSTGKSTTLWYNNINTIAVVPKGFWLGSNLGRCSGSTMLAQTLLCTCSPCKHRALFCLQKQNLIWKGTWFFFQQIWMSGWRDSMHRKRRVILFVYLLLTSADASAMLFGWSCASAAVLTETNSSPVSEKQRWHLENLLLITWL